MAKRPPSPSAASLPTLGSARRLPSPLSLVLMAGTALAALIDRNAGSVALAATTLEPLNPGTSAAAVAGIVAMTALNALFIASETALEVLRPVHLKHVRESDSEQADILQELMTGRPKYIAATNIGSHLCRGGLVVVAFMLSPGLAMVLDARFGWGTAYGMLLLATLALLIPIGLFNLILGELVPRSYALQHPHRVALLLRKYMKGASVVFAIPSALVTMVANLVTIRFGARASFAIANQTEEEIKNLVESAQESGEMLVDEKEMLHSVFQFTDTVAREVMTPRVDLDALSVHTTADAAVQLIRDSGHSRIPIFEDTDDQILGIVHAKDLLMAREQTKDVDLRSLMRPAMFVPENKNLHRLLSELRANRTQMAVVQDEFGGTAGIVTIEDIVEELVGDIIDEYDVEEEEIAVVPGGYVVDGKTHLDDLNDAIGSSLESDVFDTIGGYVFGLFGRQALPGEHIESDGYRFTVEDTDGRRIRRLRLGAIGEDSRIED